MSKPVELSLLVVSVRTGRVVCAGDAARGTPGCFDGMGNLGFLGGFMFEFRGFLDFCEKFCPYGQFCVFLHCHNFVQRRN